MMRTKRTSLGGSGLPPGVDADRAGGERGELGIEQRGGNLLLKKI